MDKFKKILNEISKLFEYDYNEYFFEFLQSTSIPNNKKCNKFVKEGWKCYDCEIYSNSLIYSDCFKRDMNIHKGHKKIFKLYNDYF